MTALTRPRLGGLNGRWLLVALLSLSLTAAAKVLDDFNGASRVGWTDANPGNLPLPPAAQSGGVFTFTMPAVGQPYFTSATKTTETFELKEGRSMEFRVDLVNGMGPDSFAVLAWIPTATGANTLAGYGLAKSETDTLVTKGIGKYFYSESPTPALKNNNVTLVLNLTARGGSVYIACQILDKDADNEVIWERSYVDTPAADIMADGTDSPAAPFITTGNVVLYLYADGGQDPLGYSVVLDNLETFVTDRVLVDDFNAAVRTGWADANPMNLPLPPAAQADGVLTFTMPSVGQAYFMSATMATSAFELSEGNRLEFSVDLVGSSGQDAFAALSWIPTATGANTLAGYGLAKDIDEILVIKGIGKYFLNEAPSPEIRNANVTLSLQLTVRSGNVTIRSRVLDKDANNAVLFDRTFVDTPSADMLADGTDSPAAPFVGTGNVVLYLYADGGKDPAGYQVVFDNVYAATPPSEGNTPPIISDVTPIKAANFLVAPATLTFKATDDKPLPDAGISVDLNGTVYTATNGLTLSGTTTSRTVTLAGIAADKVYTASLRVQDSDGVGITNVTWFDTLLAANKVVEVEDYNFDGGQSFNAPVRTMEGGGMAANSFVDRMGSVDIDLHETRTSPNADCMYRTSDSVRMQHSLDLQRAAFDNGQSIYDYDVGDITEGEWMNYTRTFAAGSYEVYLREAVVNFAQSESVLEQVTSDPSQGNQTVKVLGSFLGGNSGFTFRNVPLTDAAGAKVVVRLSGSATLRLRQVTPDGGGSTRYLNYLVFVPTADAPVQRASVSSVSPANNETLDSVRPAITVSIANRDTQVTVNTIALQVNGTSVPATVTATADGATVAYSLTNLPPANSIVNCLVTFKDSEGVDVSAAWSFTLAYKSLDPANRRPGPGISRGFKVRVVQASSEATGLANDLSRAEDQLAPNSTIPAYIDTNVVAQVINQSQDGGPAGHFTVDNGYPDDVVPGLDEFFGTDLFTVEAKGWLELPAGVYRFGVSTDDGYKLSSGSTPSSRDPVIAFHNGGPADETMDFVVSVTGFYPFRFLWYEQGGAAHGELFSVNLTTGERTLINSPDVSAAIKAYQDATAAAPTPTIGIQRPGGGGAPTISFTGTLQYSATVDGTYAPVNGASSPYTVPTGSTGFYRSAN